jgi:hypothetical protein
MNNVNKGCPPLMSDGKFLRDWRSSRFVQSLIDEQNNVQDSLQSRMFLQNNATKMMVVNRKIAENTGLCHNECSFYHVDPNGHDKYWSAYKTKLSKKI